MSLNELHNIQENENVEVNQSRISSNSGLNKMYASTTPAATFSTSDSAYNSMVGSPFSPVVLSKSSKTISPNYEGSFPTTHESISPFLESSENDEVFKESAEVLSIQTTNPQLNMASSNSFMSNTTFRPISSGYEFGRFNSSINESVSEVHIRQSNRIANLTSQRSISTQTKYSMISSPIYRPNSAPLQEGLEEELEDIYIDRLSDTNSHFHRHSTCYCIRSPMPDLIQPAFQSNSQLLVSRLSLIADQIDENISPRPSAATRHTRIRRFSTPSMADLTPGGSLIDFAVSIFNAFDINLPGRGNRRNTASSN